MSLDRKSSAKNIFDDSLLAFSIKTLSVSWFFSPIKTGVFFLIIPAFSLAIEVILSPRNFVWSYPMLVIIESKGCIIFVASSLPPNPTSIIA